MGFPTAGAAGEGSSVRRNLDVLVLLLGGFLLLAPHPTDGWLRGDSLHYAAVMKELAASDDWWNLTLAGEPYFRKPPLLLWFGAAAFDAFGATTLVARMVGVLPSLLLLLGIHALGTRLLDRTRGFLAAAICATTYVFLRNGGVPRMDTPVTLLLVLSTMVLLAGEKRPRILPLFWVLVGLGILLKGPAGILPALVAAAWSLLRRRGYPWNSPWFWAGLPAVPLLVAPWVARNLALHGDGFLKGYFVDDLAATAVNAKGKGSHLLKYGDDLLTEWWPWIPFVVHGIVLAVRRFRRDPDPEPWGLLLAWCAAVAAAVVSVQTAYSRYLVPILPATSLLAAHSLVTLLPRIPWTRAPAAGAGLVAAGALFVAAWPGSLRSGEIPDVVAFAPALRARGAAWPPSFLGRRVPGRAQEAAVFYLDTRIVALEGPALRERLARDGSLLVLARKGRSRWPAGIGAVRLRTGEEVDLVEIRPAHGNGMR